MMGVIVVLLVLGAFGLAGLGVLLLSSATAGVGVIGLALLAAVLARVAQAGDHHDQQVKRWRQEYEAAMQRYAAPAAAPAESLGGPTR